jgi:osmotically-inducible protein OsmY
MRRANDPFGDTGQMKKHVHSLTLILALGAGCALAQTMPQQQQNPGMPQTQQSPSGQAQKAAGSTADVQSDIQSAFQKEPTLASANINVRVTGNNVELSGTVPDQAAKDKAEQIARTHSGGLTVKNNIKVAGK